MTTEVEPWLAAHVDETLEKVRAGLEAPYPAHVGAPASETQFPSLTNFFRSGPCRKVFVFHDDGVDFQYDEDAREGDDIDLQSANDAIFDYVLERLEVQFGPSLGDYPGRRDSVMACEYPDDDDDDDGRETDDGMPWTPEHDGGALMTEWDWGRTRYWVIGGQNVFLQGGHITGDDNMACFVALTITPPVGEPCLEEYWPSASAEFRLVDGRPQLVANGKAVREGDVGHIQELRIDHAQLEELPASLHAMADLRRLTLDETALDNFRYPLAPFTRLEEIRFHGNRSSDTGRTAPGPAPGCVADLVAQGLEHVTTLGIRHFGTLDRTHALPLRYLKGIGRWRSLKALDLSNNNLAFTPDELGAFIEEIRQLRLDTLQLSGNYSLTDFLPDDPGRDYFSLIEEALPADTIATYRFW